MGGVTFIEPCGVIALLSCVRHCATLSGRRVLIKNLKEHLYPYLHRMDLFRVAEAWLRPLAPLNEEWSRNAHTSNLLELTPVTGYDDMVTVVERARGIFEPWLLPDELSNLLRVISELCQNIYQHSGDAHGCVLIQKYQPEQGRVSICLSVGDSGRGIRANLIKRYRGLGDDPLDFVRAAMDGNHTSRRNGRGGLGLRTVRNITAAHSGYVTVRSETAGVTDWGMKGVQSFENLTYMAGTQVSVKMCASL
jgi:signal transduction histidine kinase